MGLRRLIKSFEFSTRVRSKLTFSDPTKIRLNDDSKIDPGLTLRQTGSGFDTGLENFVQTWTVSPKGLKKWMAFEASEETPANTSVRYRVISAGVELYWDGAAWSAPSTDAHWNTQAEVNQNLQALVLTGFDFSIKVNLRSADGVSTPKVRWLKVLVQVAVESWDDLIYDTVIRSMRANLRATTVIQAAVVSTGTTLSLATDYKLENSGYNFTGVSAVYDLTNDPNKFVNLASGYTPGAARPDGTFEDGEVSLSSPINAGSIVRIEMEYEPEIAVFTGQDYYEVQRLPAVVFERINEIKAGARTDQELNDGEGDSVRDIPNGVAVYVPRPRQSTIRFEYAIHASPGDLHRLADAMDKWLSSVRTLRTWAFDEKVSLDPVQEADTGDSVNLDDIVVTTGAFQLRGVPFYVRPEQEVNLIENVNATYTVT